MRRRNITWVWLLGAAFMVGCGKQVPEDYPAGQDGEYLVRLSFKYLHGQ